MLSSLVCAKYALTEVSGRDKWKVVENAAIMQRNGIIMEIGHERDIREKYPELPAEGGADMVMIPGMVNSHHHIGLTPLQLGVPDLPLELWSPARIRMRAVDPYLDTLYSAFEMISSGVTTVQHLKGVEYGDKAASLHGNMECIRAYEEIGMRVSYGVGTRDQNRISHQMDDADFISSLPANLRPCVVRHVARFGTSVTDFLDNYERLVDHVADKELVALQLAPPNLHWMSDELLELFAEQSRRHDALMHIHLDETAHQKEYSLRRTGGSALAYLSKFGLVSERLTVGHGVWLCESDLDLAAENGVNICHNCSSNFRMRSGIAPINAFEARGINLAIGIDEAGINDDRDMLQEIRLVLNAHRVPGIDDSVPTAGQVLRMATLGGAITTPFGKKIGQIKVGSFADIVLLDWNRISGPYLDLEIGVLDAIVRRAKSDAVRTVIIGGNVVYKDGSFCKVDKEQILDAIWRSLEEPLSDFEKELCETARAIAPYIEKSYENYVSTKHEPFYVFNSKS